MEFNLAFKVLINYHCSFEINPFAPLKYHYLKKKNVTKVKLFAHTFVNIHEEGLLLTHYCGTGEHV